MEVSPIGNGNYYIQISREELGNSDIKEIVRQNVRSLPQNVFIEVYASEGGAIVFARVRRGSPVLFTFRSIDAVLAAAERCGGEYLSFLAHERGEFVLLIYPFDNEPAPAALYEYCNTVGEAHQDYARHLEEQGKLLLGPCALLELHRIFKLN